MSARLQHGCLPVRAVAFIPLQMPIKPFQQLTFATVPRGDSMEVEGGSAGDMLVFALPGDPLSSSLCFSLFLLPTLRFLSGWLQPEPRRYCT